MTTQAASAGAATLMDWLGHRFDDVGLLELALTHRSWCAEHSGSSSNERLEFLGDAVLGLVVTQRLYSRFGHRAEGDLAKARASVVNSATLAEVGGSIGLGELLRLGRGEISSGGRHKASILADAMEAVIGAVYLDGGMDAADKAVGRLLGSRLDAAATAPGHKDFKTRLQELSARLGLAPPIYDVTGSGPAHDMLFQAEVRAGNASGKGSGSTKKDAEQRAAEVAYAALVPGPERSVSEANKSGRQEAERPVSEANKSGRQEAERPVSEANKSGRQEAEWPAEVRS